MIEITATFEDGVLKPHEPLHLLPQSRVRLSIEPLDRIAEEPERVKAWQVVENLWKNSSVDSQGNHLSRDELHERN